MATKNNQKKRCKRPIGNKKNCPYKRAAMNRGALKTPSVKSVKKITVAKPVKAEKETKENTEKKSKSLNLNLKYLGGLLLIKMARGGAKLLGSNADEVNKLNVFPVPDGDTGDNMRMTIESGIAAIESMDSDNLADVMKTLSHGMLLGARGNSGVILSQFFAGTAKGLENTQKADPQIFGKALEMGVQQAYSSVMTPTEGTILTVAREAVEYAVARINKDSTIRSLFADLVKEMHASLERTPEILAVLKDAGVVDSGGAGLLYIMDGFNRVLNGEDIYDDDVANTAKSGKPKRAPITYAFGADSEMTYGYCTELLLQLQNKKTDIENFDTEALKDFLSSIGDSIVAFKTDSIVKLHVHTFTPEKVLAHCREYGEFLSVKIENMSIQHTELDGNGGAVEMPVRDAAENKPIVPKKKYGVVAVTTGEGIENLFRELGTDEIIQGGQTQNPSTNDFLEAFENISAEHIFVFPNNGNIVMAAQQAAELYDKAQVHVIPNKNIGTGYAALTALDFESDDVEKNISDMMAAMKKVKAGYVSPSIRDTEMNGLQINSGDTIGIIEKEIVVSDKDRTSAARVLASKLLEDPEKSLLTIFVGVDANEDEQKELETRISEDNPDAEVYFVDGGQEIYPYIFVAE